MVPSPTLSTRGHCSGQREYIDCQQFVAHRTAPTRPLPLNFQQGEGVDPPTPNSRRVLEPRVCFRACEPRRGGQRLPVLQARLLLARFTVHCPTTALPCLALPCPAQRPTSACSPSEYNLWGQPFFARCPPEPARPPCPLDHAMARALTRNPHPRIRTHSFTHSAYSLRSDKYLAPTCPLPHTCP